MFSSYNIKRILPRLIAAAILIQLSWALGTFAVSISNDLGKGVNLLMYEPFNNSIGGSADDISQALGNTSVAAGGTILFAGGVALALFSGVSIIGLMLLALPVLLAVAVGWFVLVLRQVLIIMCVVFLPIALLAWVLPGTERYWKLFRDNFLKLLMMYPLIVALIAAGRIFGTLGGAVGGLAGFVIVLMGFFGPLFILPKTFAWGGAALSTMGGAVVNGTKKFRDKPRESAMSGAKANRENRTSQRLTRIAKDPTSAKFSDKLFAGAYNPALKRGGARDSKFAAKIAEGKTQARREVLEQRTLKGYDNWDHPDKLKANEAWMKGESFGGIDAEGNEELQLAAVKELADLGDTNIIRQAREDGKLKGGVWIKARMENISKFNELASDMGISDDLTTVSPDAMPRWKSHTFDQWQKQVEGGYKMDNSAEGGDVPIYLSPEERQGQEARAQEQARRLISNRINFDRLSPDQQRFVEDVATRGGTQVVHQPEIPVMIPSGATLGTNAESRQSVISSLSTPNRSGTPQATAGELGQRIVSARMAPAAAPGSAAAIEQAGNEQVFTELRDRASAPDATPEIRTAFTHLHGAVESSLAQQETQVEQRYIASGSPDVSARLDAQRQRSTAVRSNLGIPAPTPESPPATPPPTPAPTRTESGIRLPGDPDHKISSSDLPK